MFELCYLLFATLKYAGESTSTDGIFGYVRFFQAGQTLYATTPLSAALRRVTRVNSWSATTEIIFASGTSEEYAHANICVPSGGRDVVSEARREQEAQQEAQRTAWDAERASYAYEGQELDAEWDAIVAQADFVG